MVLMNKDTEVLEFSLEDMYLRVINNNLLPYELKDYIKTTNPSNFKKSVTDISVFKDFLASRVILLSRENAKAILNVAALPQSLKMEDRIKIVMACHGLSMIDNFWIRDDRDDRSFDDVNLRKNKLSSVCYEIALLGKNISATSRELIPELSTLGMSPKCWVRENGTVKLIKTDKMKGLAGTLAEIEASRILSFTGANVVKYNRIDKDGLIMSSSDCISTDDLSLVHASSIRDWCMHTDIDFLDYVCSKFKTEFANMIVADYVIGNTDRHFENWGFLVDCNNDIKAFAPLYDFDLSLLIDETKGELDTLIYTPTGLTFMKGMVKYSRHATLDFSEVTDMSKEVFKRTIIYEKLRNPTSYAIKSMYP